MPKMTYEQMMAQWKAEVDEWEQTYGHLCHPKNWHPLAKRFPLTFEKVERYIQDILDNGLLNPDISLLNGKVLDGRTRLLACRRTLDTPRLVEIDPLSDVSFVMAQNVQHHRLEKSQVAMLAALAWAEQPTAKVQSRRTNINYYADLYGVSSRLCEKAKKLLPYQDFVRDVLDGGIRVDGAVLLLEREQAKRRVRRAAKRGKLPKAVEIIQGDFREVAASIPDASVNLVFVDPPYNKGSVPLYGDLNRLAARVLKPGGHVIAYLGDAWLPDALDLLRQPPLNFMALLHVPLVGRQQSMIRPRSVNVRCKTLVWLRRGETTWAGPMLDNLIPSPPPTKDLHDWEQSSAEATYLIDKLTLPGATVLDPMCGVGTTLAAALGVGDRCAIGIEIDPQTAADARDRLAAEQSAAA